MKVNMQRTKTTIYYVIFSPAFLSLSRATIENTTQAIIRWFSHMNSFIAILGATLLDLNLRTWRSFRKISNWLQAQSSTRCFLQKQKIGHGEKIEKTFHSIFYFTQLRRLISNILWKLVGLFLPSTTEILDFTVSLSL